MSRLNRPAQRPRILVALGCLWLTWLLQLPPRPDAWLVFVSGLPLVVLGSRIAASRANEPWKRFVARTADVHALVAVLLFALGVQFEDAHGITTDGVIYFSQLRSVVFDRDLDVAREFVYLQQPPRPGHIVPIGPTLLWLPLYLTVAMVDAVGRMAGWWAAPADPIAMGLTAPYVRAAMVSSFAIAAVGLVVVHRLLRREFDRLPAFAGTVLLLGGTSLLWYMVYEPAMTHAASFGFVALFVAAVIRYDPFNSTSRQLAWAGVLLGLAFITRPQEAVFALLPAIYVLGTPEPLSARLWAATRYARWGLVGFAPFLALQLAHSYVLFSREDLALVGEGGFLNLLGSRWPETLWSSWHGFLSWTPVAYIALLGTVAYARRNWRWAVAAVMVVFVMAWINGATPDLGSGWSFGGRRFVSCLVLLAPGLALIAQAMVRHPMTSIAMLSAAAVGWNYLLMEQYRSGLLPLNAPVSFAQVLGQQADVYTRPPYFYPFAFPANAWFAWRTGLPVDRYDLLGTEPLHRELDLKLEGSAGRFLLEGWGAPTSDPSGSAWWIAATPATLTLPLRLPDDRKVRVEVQARARLTTPVVLASIEVRVNDQPIGSFTPQAEQPSVSSFTTTRDIWKDGFNRVTFVSQPMDIEGKPGVWPVAIYRIRITPSDSP